MRILAGALALALSLGGPAMAQSGSARASDGAFTGIALVTDDPAWFEQFQRPEPPEIKGRETFTPGIRGALAIIFSNAEPRDGNVTLECDITAYYPEGEPVVVVQGGVCYQGPYLGENVLHPALIDLQFEVDAGDPEGQSGFEITLRDPNSGRSVDLSVSYRQEQAE